MGRSRRGGCRRIGPNGKRGWSAASGGLRRLLGIDRSGPPPPATVRGAPLNPWTLPNAIGFVRLALLPAFLALALTSGDGRAVAPAVIYAAVAVGDYLDGIAARVTGQYSRLGALMDPLIDRLLVLSGAVVAWRFDLLPRWAIAVLAARELLMVALTRFALRRGLDVRINWIGRLAVWPTMAAFFGAMIWTGWGPRAVLYVGLAMTLAATALYLRDASAVARGDASAHPSQ